MSDPITISRALKKLLLAQGHQTLGAKDVFSKAYALGFLDDERTWLQMIEDRNQSSHVYDEKSAMKIVSAIKSKYLAAFEELIQQHFSD